MDDRASPSALSDEALDAALDDCRPIASDSSPQLSPERNHLVINPAPPASAPRLRKSHRRGADPVWEKLVNVLQAVSSPSMAQLDPAETIDNMRELLQQLSWLRNPAAGQIEALREKERRNAVLDPLMGWMKASDTAAVAIGVCGILLRLTAEDYIVRESLEILFKLSRNKRFDALFARHGVSAVLTKYLGAFADVPAKLGRMLKGSEAVFLIHASACLKYVSDDEANAIAVAECGGGDVVENLFRAVLESSSPHPNAVALLIQLTALLRNLANVQPVSASTLRALLSLSDDLGGANGCGQDNDDILSDDWTDNTELMMNVVRVLSICSQRGNDMLEAMRVDGSAKGLVGLMVKYQRSKPRPQPLLVRVLFALGNLTTTAPTLGDVATRSELASVQCLEDMAALFGVYADIGVRRLQGQVRARSRAGDASTEDGGRTEGWERDAEEVDPGVDARIDKETLEVLVKMVRLLANMAINPDAGIRLSEMIELEGLVDLLGELEFANIAETEELFLNLLSALANFTFYHEPSNVLSQKAVKILEAINPLLLKSTPEALVLSTRIIANLSRRPPARRWLASHRGGLELLCILLDHSEPDVTVNVCGALCNVLGPAAGPTGGMETSWVWSDCVRSATAIRELGGIEKLVGLVEDALARRDTAAALVYAKALGNLARVDRRIRESSLPMTVEEEEDEEEGDADRRDVRNRIFSEDEEESLGVCLLDFVEKTKLDLGLQAGEPVEEGLARDEVMQFRALALGMLADLGFGDVEEDETPVAGGVPLYQEDVDYTDDFEEESLKGAVEALRIASPRRLGHTTAAGSAGRRCVETGVGPG
ncbi:Armadillo repeat-containing protein 2 [Irineochytrium annulatum]|nr:Armadillo repeat-containing protein 2 [Irineochytrium annulatum]